MSRATPEERRLACVLAPVGAHLLHADSRVVDRAGWYQVVTPSCPTGALNEVVLSELDGCEVDAVIDRVAAEYGSLGLPCKWCVGPWTRPADTGERLVRRGFVPWDVRGMGTASTLEIAPPADVRVERVAAARLDLYLEASAAGWDRPGHELEASRAAHEEALAVGALELFVASLAGRPAGVASLRPAPARSPAVPGGAAYLAGAVVLPGSRGRGVYRALLAARLARLCELGVEYAVTQAREATSAPILARLGFETLFTSRCYELPPPRR